MRTRRCIPVARFVAIITDGNGRWAAERGLPAIEGHQAGADVVKARLRDAAELGIQELTVFSFSTENWTRPADEVDGLMAMFAERIDRETPELDDEGVRMRFIGRRECVGESCVERMEWAEETTAANERITLFVAFNYGGRAEIVDAARSFEGGGEDEFRALLYAPEMHDPDLLIRTSGEQRISNFLLWQCAYSELVFSDELWPDFTREAFEAALAEYETRAPPVRGALMEGSRPFDSELDFDQPRRNRPSEPPPPCRGRPRRDGGEPQRRPLGDSRPDRLGDPLDRGRGHDRDRRRRAVRGGDDRLRAASASGEFFRMARDARPFEMVAFAACAGAGGRPRSTATSTR